MEILTIILTALLSILALFLIAKAMGHKQIAQLDFFDYISGITIGSIAAELATDLQTPQFSLIALLLYGLVSIGLHFLTQKFPRTRKFINGTPTILMNNGKIYQKNLKKSKLDLSEFLLLCREQGYFDLNKIQLAIFEANGKLSILPCSDSQPLTAKDLKLTLPQAEIGTEIIMDGRILDSNLRRMGLDPVWLKKKVKENGFQNEKEILLGIHFPAEDRILLYGYS